MRAAITFVMLLTVASAWLLLPVLVVAGCGGSGGLARESSASCMRLQGAQVSTKAGRLDAIARGADG